jgi:hypothetical protein
MRIAIYNNKGRPRPDPKNKGCFLPDPKNRVEDFLNAQKRTLPPFEKSKEREYDGLVAYVDDDDTEDFISELETAGFHCETE